MYKILAVVYIYYRCPLPVANIYYIHRYCSGSEQCYCSGKKTIIDLIYYSIEYEII